MIDMKEVIKADREREAQAYHDHISLRMAVYTMHYIDLVLRMSKEDTVIRGIFVSEFLNEFHDLQSEGYSEFKMVTVRVTEDNRGITLSSPDKGAVIVVTEWMQRLAKKRGFTITL